MIVIMTTGQTEQSAATRVAQSRVAQAGATASSMGALQASWLNVTACRQQTARRISIAQVLMCLAGRSAHTAGTRVPL